MVSEAQNAGAQLGKHKKLYSKKYLTGMKKKPAFKV